MPRLKRRTILKQGGAVVAGLTAVTGTTSAGSGSSPSPDEDSGDSSFEKEGSGAGVQDASKLPDALQVNQSNAQQDGKASNTSRDHLEYRDHLTWTATPRAATEDLADVEMYITLCQAINNNNEPATGSDGEYWYVMEIHMESDEYDHFGYEGATRKLQMGAEFGPDTTAHERDPATTRYVDGEWLTTQAGGEAGGIGFSSSQKQWVDHGQIGPEYWTPGEGDNENGNADGARYGLEFNGDSPGGKTIDYLGAVTVSNPSDTDEIWDVMDYWEGYCYAYLKTI